MKIGTKAQNTYDRVKSELDCRGAIPIGNKHQESPWEVVPTTKA